MKYQFIKEHCSEYSVERMAWVLQVSCSGYYAWLKRPPSRRAKENACLDVKIKSVYEASGNRYGSMKITRELQSHGEHCSRNRVAGRMRKLEIMAKTKRKFRATTNSKHHHPIAPNLLNRNFSTDAANKVWVSDITYIRTKSGWAYLTVFIDLYSRIVTGWSVSHSLDRQMVLEALEAAIGRRKPGQGLVIHSDRGVQYACNDFRGKLQEHRFKQSMSRKGDCWDNAVAESFFKIVKTELIYHESWQDIHHLKHELFEYIELFYNRKRLHSTLDYQCPADFEQSNCKKLD